MIHIDLNSDLGESFGAWTMGDDEALMPSLTSANIACGMHAGDPRVMRQTVTLAKRHGVAIGAHPGFPDLAGFGRRDMQLSAQEIEDLVLYQVAALAGVAAAEGMTLQHHRPGRGGVRPAARVVRPARLLVDRGRRTRRPARGR
jgi:5-oxoprolinase (ATP-hydrolysing) subunit A